jgi:hypothetical protein
VWGITLSPYFLRSYLPVLYIFSLSFFTCQHVSIQHQIQQMLKQCTATKRESVASLFVGRTRVAGQGDALHKVVKLVIFRRISKSCPRSTILGRCWNSVK